MCFLRPIEREKALPHVSHEKGLSPECTKRCLVRSLDVVKALPHVSHEKGLSPECTKRCLVRWLDVAKVLPQAWQEKGLSLVISSLFSSCILRLPSTTLVFILFDPPGQSRSVSSRERLELNAAADVWLGVFPCMDVAIWFGGCKRLDGDPVDHIDLCGMGLH